MSPLVSLQIDETTHRRLSIRFRTSVRGQTAELEVPRTQRHLGIPEPDALPFKREVDVLIEGWAYPARAGDFVSDLRLRVGELDRKTRVFGPRRVLRHRDKLRIEAPGELERVQLSAQNAYGGGPADGRYPRNPLGKGYCVSEELAEGMMLPPLEEAGDLLSSDRLVCAPEHWWKQPRPALWTASLLTSFPRCVYAAGWLPLPDAPFGPTLAEVRDGDLETSPLERSDWRFAQEMPSRGRLAGLPAGTEILLEGCLPLGRARRWKAPPIPVVELAIDGHISRQEAALQTLRLLPEQDSLSLTYALEVTLPRAFVPGIHARIPIRASVLGETVDFETPLPMLRRLRESRL